jgi:hypothetical protein
MSVVRGRLVPILVLAASLMSFAPTRSGPARTAVAPVPRALYLAYAKSSADWAYAHREDLLAAWRKSFDPDNVFGYRPPGGLLETAAIYGHFFRAEKNREYGRRVRDLLLGYGDYRSIYPGASIERRADYADGVPALPDFFTVMRYIRAYDAIRASNLLDDADRKRIEDLVAHSLAYLLRTQEWGPMNRAALRAESLAWAVRALPGHPDAPKWEMQRRALGDDNWGGWQIEDATVYNGVWLYSLLGYADALGRVPELLRTPVMYYYARYYLRLMGPAGAVPDFGDAHRLSNWAHFLAFFEAAAGELRDPELKWAAATIARRYVDFAKPENVGLGYMLLDCARWGADGVPARTPAALSGEVLEDLVGKKVVFRNGWEADSTYLLLNYRDEGDGGVAFRDYLRDTIPVEEEKMTHGHADENGVALLMSGGSVLLHDGGYRDYMPSGPFGAYRQDYFHNRLCVRPEKIWMGQAAGESRYSVRDAVPAQSVLDFLHNAGSYRRVRTQKIDVLTFPDFDYSRTRLIDEGWGFDWDRVVVYVHDPEAFVVFDVFKARREEYFTLAGLWHARKIFAQGPHWYDAGYDRIQSAELPGDRRLLVRFPLTHFRSEGVEPERRHYQDEVVIHQTAAQHFELGETAGLVTVLVPHRADVPAGAVAAAIEPAPAAPAGAALAVFLSAPGRRVLVGVKTDLRRDTARDWRRPRYVYEAGRIQVGDFETDGDLVFGATSGNVLAYAIVNLTKAVYRKTVLVEAKPSLFGLAFDAEPDRAGIGKLRYWRGEVAAPERRP